MIDIIITDNFALYKTIYGPYREVTRFYKTSEGLVFRAEFRRLSDPIHVPAAVILQPVEAFTEEEWPSVTQTAKVQCHKVYGIEKIISCKDMDTIPLFSPMDWEVNRVINNLPSRKPLLEAYHAVEYKYRTPIRPDYLAAMLSDSREGLLKYLLAIGKEKYAKWVAELPVITVRMAPKKAIAVLEATF